MPSQPHSHEDSSGMTSAFSLASSCDFAASVHIPLHTHVSAPKPVDCTNSSLSRLHRTLMMKVLTYYRSHHIHCLSRDTSLDSKASQMAQRSTYCSWLQSSNFLGGQANNRDCLTANQNVVGIQQT